MSGRNIEASGERAAAIAGLISHILVTLPMLGAGVGKTFHLAPQRVLSMFETTYHLDQQMTMIGLGELLCVVLLLVPRTLPFGILMVSAYWGGAIVVHMSSAQSYLVPSVLLFLSWVGYFPRLDRHARRALLKSPTTTLRSPSSLPL